MLHFNVKTDEDSDETLALSFDFGGDIQEVVDNWGEKAVYSRFLQGATINLQGGLRAAMKKSELPTNKGGKARPMKVSEVNDWLKKFKVEPVSEKQSKVTKASKVINTMSPDELAELEAMIAGLK